MNISFKNLFGRSSYSPLLVSDWLLNMRDSFLTAGRDAAEGDPNSPIILSSFTLAMSSHSTSNILHIYEKSIKKIEDIFFECRGYYDCLWQMHLLTNIDSDEDVEKIRNLAALVDFQIMYTLESVFSSNKNINNLLGNFMLRDHNKFLDVIVPLYIHGGFKSENWVNDVIKKITLRISKYIGDRDQWPHVYVALRQDTLNSLKIKFFTGFDVKRCNIINFPKEMLIR